RMRQRPEEAERLGAISPLEVLGDEHAQRCTEAPGDRNRRRQCSSPGGYLPGGNLSADLDALGGSVDPRRARRTRGVRRRRPGCFHHLARDATFLLPLAQSEFWAPGAGARAPRLTSVHHTRTARRARWGRAR